MADSSKIFKSHVGVWCEFTDFGGLGVVAEHEFEFEADGRCAWSCLRDTGKDVMIVRREGKWTLAKEVISMKITHSTEQGVAPERQADFKIFDREGRLGLTCTRLDDEVAKKGFSSYFLQPAEAGIAVRTLQAARQKALASKKLPAPYSSLEVALTAAIPAAVQKLKVSQPICCLRLYYHDTHVPREEYGMRLRVVTEPLRSRLQASQSNPANLAEEFWCPQSGIANGAPDKNAGLYEIDFGGNKDLKKSWQEIYDQLSQLEDEHMPLVQQVARRVCKKLNSIKWEGQAEVTDDFVAVPADGSGYFGDEYADDLDAAVPASRRKLLTKRGYLA